MTDKDQLIKYLADKKWRLFSGKLYFIKDKQGNKIPFIPNEAQTHYYENRHTKNIILKARQLWFSTLIDIDLIDDVLFNSYISAGIIADDRDSSEMIFRDKVKFAYDNLPEWLKANFKVKTDRKWELVFESNHCSISVDTSFRWGTLQRLHISEYWKICNKYPEKAREIQTGALNTIAPTSQADIESTAEGNSWYFYDMCKRAMDMEELWKELTEMDYKFHFYAWWLDKAYSLEKWEEIRQETIEYFQTIKQDSYIQRKYPNLKFTEAQMRWYQKKKEEQKEDMQREYPSYPKEAFDLAIKGAYYEAELSLAREQKRVWKFYYDSRLPVNTAWDLWGAWGGDSTAIWFYQIYWREVRLIDYFETSGRSMTEIILSVVNPRYNNYETHYLPHDVAVTEYSTWVARIQTAKEHLQGRVEVVPKLSISDGIWAVRDMFPNCYFNEETTTLWFSMLWQYKRAYDEKNWVFLDRPVDRHKSKHGSDAFRYLAVMYKQSINVIDYNDTSFEVDYDDYL